MILWSSVILFLTHTVSALTTLGPGPCDIRPCRNAGTCVMWYTETDMGYACECPAGTTGYNCLREGEVGELGMINQHTNDMPAPEACSCRC